MRIFISINLPENVKKEIKKIQDSLPEFVGKKTKIENLHLTLKFLNEIDEKRVEEVKKRLGEIRFGNFEAEISNLGVFSEKFVKIVWVYLKNCTELQGKVDESLKGLFKPEKRFMSHLTIARVKKIEDKQKFLDELKKIKVPRIKFVVDRFYLMKSELRPEGPEYSVIEEYCLE